MKKGKGRSKGVKNPELLRGKSWGGGSIKPINGSWTKGAKQQKAAKKPSNKLRVHKSAKPIKINTNTLKKKASSFKKAATSIKKTSKATVKQTNKTTKRKGVQMMRKAAQQRPKAPKRTIRRTPKR
ncbi:MAG: hypothetical protein AAF849_24485 [Bacteroidota bacterium]